MIHAFSVENFKSLKTERVDLSPLTILSGINNSGKTTFIKSILELFGFDDDGEHVQEFFNEILANYKWGKGQYVKISNLNEKGILSVDKHVLNKEEEK